MKHTRLQWIILFSLLMKLSGLGAQTSLNVIEKKGTQTSFILKNIMQMTFEMGNMTVKTKDLSASIFPIINIGNMNFMDIIAADEITSDQNSKFSIYPNPVNELLNVQYKWSNAENILIQIIDIQGKMLYQQKLIDHTGTNQISISVGNFPKGLYLFRLINGEESEIKKFIKH